MTKKFEIYKCETCGNLVEILKEGEGELVCCGKPMELQEHHTVEEIKGEYHMPVMEKTEDGQEFIKVGEKPHPMLEEHHIEFVEMISEDNKTVIHKFLSVGDEPRVKSCDCLGDYAVRAHCNLHGLWANMIKHHG